MIRKGVWVLNITRSRAHEVIEYQIWRFENCKSVVSIGRRRTTEGLPLEHSDGAGDCEQQKSNNKSWDMNKVRRERWLHP
jgi:hypothetical protein